MPIGGRTPDSPQPHNPAPVPTDSGICAISPSDLVGAVGNLINEVKLLRQEVEELKAGNIEANQLSDLSQQVGWVGGITYMGIDGWTQTEYGTLIPPPGFTLLGNGVTMSDGNTYSAVVYDEDGVLQYGFGQVTSDGTFTAVTGASSRGGFAVISTDEIIAAGTPGNTSAFATLHSEVDDSNIITVSGTTFSVNQSGFYNLSIATQFITNQAVAGVIGVQWSVSGQPAGALAIDPRRAVGPTIFHHFPAGAGFGVPATSARMMYVDSAATHSISGVGTGVGATFGIPESTLTIELIQTAQL